MQTEEKEESGSKPKWICQQFFNDLKKGIETLAFSHARAAREQEKKIDDLKETMYKEINPMKLQLNAMQVRMGLVVAIAVFVSTRGVDFLIGLFHR